MITGFTGVEVAAAVVAGLLAVVLGLAGRRPSDLVLAGPVLIELLLLVQAGIAIVAPFTGNRPTGNPVEFAAYLLGALAIPPAVVYWALTERTRWSVVVVGVGCLAVAVMLVRMQIIWTVQGV